MAEPITLESDCRVEDKYMEAKHKDILSPENDGLDSRLSFNDQGSAKWYEDQFPHFPEEYYQIFELYTKGGVRYKEFRNLMKKLDKKGRLKKPSTESLEETFKKINFDDSNDELLDQPVSLCPAADIPKQQMGDSNC